MLSFATNMADSKFIAFHPILYWTANQRITLHAVDVMERYLPIYDITRITSVIQDIRYISWQSYIVIYFKTIYCPCHICYFTVVAWFESGNRQGGRLSPLLFATCYKTPLMWKNHCLFMTYSLLSVTAESLQLQRLFQNASTMNGAMPFLKQSQ